MKYRFDYLTIEEAKEISNWKYNGFMESIYMKPYFDNYKPGNKMIGPDNCEGFSVRFNGELFGLFEYYHPEDELEIGLAINPKFVNKGLASNFVLEGISFGVQLYNYNKSTVRLLVNPNNIPAHKAYLRAGFKDIEQVDEEILMRFEIYNIKR